MSEEKVVTNLENASAASPPIGETPKDCSPASPESAVTSDNAVISDAVAASESAATPEAEKVSGVSVMKPSGLKPPSKISRPCAGQAKPALPVPVTPPGQSE